MRLLVIIHSYFPVNSPRSFRWTSICEHWLKQGTKIDVVCSKSHKGLESKETIKGVNVYRVPDISLYIRQEERIPGQQSNKIGKDARRSCIKEAFKTVLKKVAIFIRWPDHAWFWVPLAYKKSMRLLKTHQYDGIISVAIPFSCHVVALLLGKLRQGIPWLCDYGDPFSIEKAIPYNNLKLYNLLNRYVERNIINCSRRISVTTVETAKEYAEKLGVNKDWFRVIPHLANQRILFVRNKGRKTINKQNVINLVFAGNLYSSIRNSKYLLALLQKTRNECLNINIKVHFLGGIGSCLNEFKQYESSINDWIILHGPVDVSELNRIYHESADVLVNIGNASAFQSPSKVVEYMSTGLPILNIASSSEDLSIPVLKTYPSVLTIMKKEIVADEDVEALHQFFISMNNVNPDLVMSLTKKYQIESIVSSYQKMLGLICQN